MNGYYWMKSIHICFISSSRILPCSIDDEAFLLVDIEEEELLYESE